MKYSNNQNEYFQIHVECSTEFDDIVSKISYNVFHDLTKIFIWSY